MRFSIASVILVCWATLSATDKIPGDINESSLQCKNDHLFLNFSNSVIIDIGRNFISSSLITCLDLRNNRIENISNGAFRQLPNLTSLYLSNNKLTNSHSLFVFGGHANLKFLALNNAVYNRVSSSIRVFGEYPNLEILMLSQNGFHDLWALHEDNFSLSTMAPAGNATGKVLFPKLKLLDLSGNVMRGNNFVNLLPKSLKHLHLRDNAFDTLSLKKMRELVTLTLDKNRIAVVKKNMFLADTKNLRHLSISKNEIHTIESNAFEDSKNLNYLNLSGNKIYQLSAETFTPLKSLETLDLSANRFKTVPKMSNERNIKFLSLSCNKIDQIMSNAFQQTPRLRELLLDGNEIEKIQVDSFVYLHKLQKLNLSRNKLKHLPEGWTGSFTDLSYLDLSDNRFTSLESLSLTNGLPLMEVYLEMNPLEYLNAKSLENLPRNVTVNLTERSGLVRCQ